jgi:DNA polymerase-3 subunit epsilon
VGDDVVVAHNARFDVGVIRHACSIDGIASPTVRFLCTLVMARRALSLPSYSLPFVVEALGIRSENHHDPLADATAVAGIVRKLAERASETNLAGLANSLHVAIGWLREGTYGGSASLEHRPGLIHPGVNRDADPDSHLYGRVVVFTGALTSMTRQSAWEECARAGAIPQANTTKRTNVLVVGDVDPAYLRPGATITGKTRKVFELQARGQDIEIMTEDEFLQCLADKPLDPEAANGNGIRGHSD